MTPLEITAFLAAMLLLFVGVALAVVGAYLTGAVMVLLAGFVLLKLYRSLGED